MPKRVATPPPGDDEPKYLTICYPYPPHANVELPGDRLALARWLACCMGTSNDLYAIFHKPSAPNMVIIEVRRDYSGYRRLLGAHKWSEFVISPGQHGDKVTKIYYSTFPNGRAVEKAGWKRIFVADDWFKDFSPHNRYITFPYPTSSYCDPPSENQTGFTLCRPIPRETFFAIQIPAPPPLPVGSAGWAARKEIINAYERLTATDAVEGMGGQRGFPPPGLNPSTSELFKFGSPADVNNPGPDSYYNSYDGSGTAALSGYNSEEDSNESIEIATGNYVAGSADPDDSTRKVEEDFGTLPLQQPVADKNGTPTCPSHGIICKKSICRDYARMLKKVEKDKLRASSDEKRGNGAPSNTASDIDNSSGVWRGKGRGNYRARGSSWRGGMSRRGTNQSASGRSAWW